MKQRKYGFINEPKDTDFIFGAGKIPEEVLVPDGNWEPYLPVREFQAPYGFETYACVTFTLLTCLEAQIKRRYGVEENFSDRFLAIVSGTKSPGNSPQAVCEFLRKIGVVPEELWPYTKETNSWEKWSSPIPPKLYELAKEFNAKWDFRYEQVPSNPEAISKALTMSMLMVSVPAWFPRNGRYYRPQGMRDNHATSLFQERKGEFRRIFDSYDSPHIKDVEWGVVSEFVQRYWIKKKVEVVQQISLIQKIINVMLSLLGLLKEQETYAEPPKIYAEPAKPMQEPKPSITQMADAIKIYEGFFPPSSKYPKGSNSWRNNNPGNLKGLNGKFLTFTTYEQGYFALCDYIKRVGLGKHKKYPPNCDIRQFFLVYAPAGDSNHPIAYGVWIAQRLGVLPDFKIKDLYGIM